MTVTLEKWKFPLTDVHEHHKTRIEGNEDIVPFVVEAWRHGQDFADWTVMICDGNPDVQQRDSMLMAGNVMARVTGCDYLLLSYDTHATTLAVNPNTGQPWGPGEMQKMCDDEGFCDTGQMRDNLVITVIRRSDQKIHNHFIPYHFHKGGLMFFEETDLDEWVDDEKHRHGGRIPDALRAIMAADAGTKELGEMVSALGFDMNNPEDAARVRLHKILAGIQVLSRAAQDIGLPELFMHVVPARTEVERAIMDGRGMIFAPGADAEEAK